MLLHYQLSITLSVVVTLLVVTRVLLTGLIVSRYGFRTHVLEMKKRQLFATKSWDAHVSLVLYAQLGKREEEGNWQDFDILLWEAWLDLNTRFFLFLQTHGCCWTFPLRPLQFNYLSYELFLEKKSCQTTKKKEKKSHLWTVLRTKVVWNFLSDSKKKKEKKCKF